jgi:multidrug efflux pump subunit AcrA (membrane-fusion protein)
MRKVPGCRLQAAGLILFLCGLAGCQPPGPQQELPKEVIPVKVARLVPADLRQTIDYVGNIKAAEEALIYPKVSGKVIAKVKQDGAPVAKGEPLVYLDRDEVGFKYEPAPVESTLSGIVGRVYVDKGDKVTAQTAVALVVAMEEVKITLDIPEKYLSQVELKQQARIAVDAWPQEEFIGEVTKISPVVDLDTRSAPIEISLDNSRHILKSGMFARVKLVIGEARQSLLIAKEAMMGSDTEAFVYVIENKKAVLKKVLLGLRQGPYFEVKQGLQPGDLVVVMGQQRLSEGSAVIFEE